MLKEFDHMRPGPAPIVVCVIKCILNAPLGAFTPVLYLYSCLLVIRSIRAGVNIRFEAAVFSLFIFNLQHCWLRVSTLSVSSQFRLGGYLCVCMWL